MKSFLKNFFILLFGSVLVFLHMFLGYLLKEVAGVWGLLAFILATLAIFALVFAWIEKRMEDDDED